MYQGQATQSNELGNKRGNSLIYIMRFCTKARVLQQKITNHVKVEGTNVRGNNVS
jgi:hypothetical protein